MSAGSLFRLRAPGGWVLLLCSDCGCDESLHPRAAKFATQKPTYYAQNPILCRFNLLSARIRTYRTEGFGLTCLAGLRASILAHAKQPRNVCRCITIVTTICRTNTFVLSRVVQRLSKTHVAPRQCLRLPSMASRPVSK